jgi:hypothetical protein
MMAQNNDDVDFISTKYLNDSNKCELGFTDYF